MSFYYVYVLRNKNKNFTYVGYTADLKKRFSEHNNKEVTSTKPYSPLELIHYEAYINRKDAIRREKYFKTTKGRTTLKLMLREYLS